ncbi:MAG: hypothetical protein M1547_07800, partial [Gammaproteobacteria bacterium]|nr:hypothetical protein [Gammaproteobacteria bacterium]
VTIAGARFPGKAVIPLLHPGTPCRVHKKNRHADELVGRSKGTLKFGYVLKIAKHTDLVK